ncbi:MAG: LemA family protein [Agathobacter sp.]|nr:LemA family protein [Agathobacter sp.]
MIWIIVGIVLVVIVGWIVSTYNSLVQLRNKVKNAFAQIDAQLQRRFDLIPNLVETIKGYAGHEKEVLENVTASRSGYMNATSNEQKLEMNNQLTSTLKTLFAVAENYPDLKANTNFMSLQEELSKTEDKVVYARQFYNDAVTIYNNKLQMFPSNVVAGMFGFKEEALFDAVDEANQAPRVQF